MVVHIANERSEMKRAEREKERNYEEKKKAKHTNTIHIDSKHSYKDTK